MKPNLFGTDGIRAGSGAYPLDDPSLVRLGAVIGSLSPSPRILIARDTRESGPTIEAQLCRGLGRGARVFSAGVLPTPGLAFLTRELGFDFGIMVSASHNPFSDNGIKLFNRSGEKISARLENAISAGFPHLPFRFSLFGFCHHSYVGINFLRGKNKKQIVRIISEGAENAPRIIGICSLQDCAGRCISFDTRHVSVR